MRENRWRRSRIAAARRLTEEGIERADTALLRSLDRDFREAARRAGPRLACGPGCSDCCHGPFPITRLDVRRLLRGLERLAAIDPQRAAALVERAVRATRILAADCPRDPVTGLPARADPGLERFLASHRELPCPVLDPETGSCGLYEWRPVCCRTYGPPLRFGTEATPPCQLCFVGASVDELEFCRVTPDPEHREERILAGMGVRSGEDWETLVAFALDGWRAGRDPGLYTDRAGEKGVRNLFSLGSRGRGRSLRDGKGS